MVGHCNIVTILEIFCFYCLSNIKNKLMSVSVASVKWNALFVSGCYCIFWQLYVWHIKLVTH